ncbi:hypothetical protein VNO77_23549 [Canavalia gladiata]|uniref:Uncharacterized protein n=1 Tax=Canavalia gladiata TaxID=3824 RepID=A0AAN9L5E9_CANGL
MVTQLLVYHPISPVESLLPLNPCIRCFKYIIDELEICGKDVVSVLSKCSYSRYPFHNSNTDMESNWNRAKSGTSTGFEVAQSRRRLWAFSSEYPRPSAELSKLLSMNIHQCACHSFVGLKSFLQWNPYRQTPCSAPSHTATICSRLRLDHALKWAMLNRIVLLVYKLGPLTSYA